MPASRLRKRLSRAFVVSWREQPTRFDIEALQDNIRRVGLVVRVRWHLIVVLVAYSLIGGGLYASRMDVLALARLMALPAVSLVIVVLYNAFYTLNYRRLGNIAVWNNLQLALDALVVTVLLYFSGGADSWFWSMYALFILEATFILPEARAAWLHALFCCLLLGAVEWAEFARVLPHIMIPFAEADLHTDFLFVSIRFLWQVAVLLGVAWVSTQIVGEFRRELESKGEQSLVDETTGLYSRSYFMRALAAELRRAERDGRPLHVILIDIDQFGRFNERFGIDRGDEVLKEIARTIDRAIVPAGDSMASVNVVARYGGEEFVVLLAEDIATSASLGVDEAVLQADRIRALIEEIAVDGAGVTVSIGVASAPDDGQTADALLDAADAALVEAVEGGGNRVCHFAESANLPG